VTDLAALHSSLHPRAHIPARALIPAALVALLALTSAQQDSACPAGTDGPQFACWLHRPIEDTAPL